MGRSTRTSVLKRQRELRKAERAAAKRARRHGKPIEGSREPRPTPLAPDASDETAPPAADDDPTTP